MVQPNDPDDPALWRAYEMVERETIAAADLSVFTTEGTRELYRSRYPEQLASRFEVVENGYDAEVFSSGTSARRVRAPGRPIVLLHSGAIYPLERDPTQFFLALRAFLDRRSDLRHAVSVRLRATGHDADIQGVIDKCSVSDHVHLAPALPYRDAIAEMMDADALLVLQGGQVKTQVPAKIYEYLRAGRPILALTAPEGDTARVLRRAGVEHIAPIDSPMHIARELEAVVLEGLRGTATTPHPDEIERASRRNRAGELSVLLDRVTDGRQR